MSRKRAPVRLRLAKGRGRDRDSGGRLVLPPPAFARLAPEKPDDLSPAASDCWDATVAELARLDLLGPHHAAGLRLMVESYALAAEALATVWEEATLVTAGPQGQSTSANFRAYLAASKEHRAWAGEFGLTPSSETRLGVKAPPATSDNPFAGPLR